MYKRVLVPLDGSAAALQVVPYATMIAKATGAKVALIRAVNGYPAELVKQVSHEFIEGQPSYPPSLQTWASVQEQIRDETKRGLEDAASTIRAAGVVVDTIVAENEPAEAIVIEAEREPDTIIAISTHGRSGVGR
ncbi:MAG: universal stress protein [Chloroflexi bacterium]|nr:universal stress protein [Chloroflexota bacterium]